MPAKKPPTASFVRPEVFDAIAKQNDQDLRTYMLRLAMGATAPGIDQEKRVLETATAMYRFVTSRTVVLN